MNPENELYPDKISLEGRFANFFKVGHNAFEFVFIFGQFYPENGYTCLHTRIVTNPVYTKHFLQTLKESIKQYEETFGVIQRGGNSNTEEL